MMETILVTGGAGYVGSTVVRALLREGYKIICMDNLSFGGESLLDVMENPSFSLFVGDISREEDVQTLFERFRVEAVVHLAAIVGDPACKANPELANRVNWEGSRLLYENAKKNQVGKFIFASTCSNYGKMDDRAGYVDEESPLAPVSLYAELKVRFEQYLMENFINSRETSPTILRFATVYGLSPRMRFDLTVNEFAKELSLGRELTVFGEQFWRPYCHVRDFSRAILAVLRAPLSSVAGAVFNVGDTTENYTKKMIVDELLRQIPEARVQYVQRNEDPRDYRVSFKRINHILKFNISRTVPEGIAEIRNAVQAGIYMNTEDPRFYNCGL